MKLDKDIISISHLKSKAADLLEQINTTGRPVIITQNGEARAVLQDPESYENLRNAVGLLKLISQGEKDIRSGDVVEQDEMFEELRQMLRSDPAKS